MKNKLTIGILSLLALVGVVVVGLIVNQQQSTNPTLIVAYEYSQLDSILLVAREQKLFEKYLPDNVNVEWVMLDSGSDRRDALATERVSIATINNMRIITAIENDYPVQILSNGMGQPLALYTVKSGMTYPDDIIGKTVAYQGSYSIPLKTELGKNHNIPADDYQLLMVGGDQELIDMLVQGQVDAVVMNKEKGAKAVALRPDIRELFDLTPEYNRLGMRNWFVSSSKFFEKHPELLQPVISAYQEALEEINNDPAEMAKLIAPILEIDAVQVESEFRMLPPVMEIYGYDEMAAILLENGDIDKPAMPFNQLPNYESIPKK